MVTRPEIARLFGVTRQAVAKMESAGKLTATIDAVGRHLFLREEVLELARIRGRHFRARVEGKLAARVFDLFEQGCTLPQIVQQTGEHPTTIRALWAEYTTPLKKPRDKGDDGETIREATADLQSLLERFGLNQESKAT